MKEQYDVVIAGAGPAGSSLALFLSKRGIRPLLVDKAKFPRDKTCGDGISGKSMRLLQELGMNQIIENGEHTKITGVAFSSPDGTALTVKAADKRVCGYVVRREVFDNHLFQQARKGADVQEETQLVRIAGEEDGLAQLELKDLKSGEVKAVRTKLLVGADGAQSVVGRHIGIDYESQEHLIIGLRAYYDNVEGNTDDIEMHFVDEVLPGYFWIFPGEGKRANVGVGMVSRDMRRQNTKLKEAMLNAMHSDKFRERFKNARQISEIRGWTLPCGSKQRNIVADHMLLVGDAAALIDPFTGEGIGNAMLSAKIASTHIQQAVEKNDFSRDFLMGYEKELFGTIGGELKTDYRVMKLLKHRWLLNFFIHKAVSKKEVSNAIAHSFTKPMPTKKVLSLAFWRKILF